MSENINETTRHLKFRYISLHLEESKYNESLTASSFHLYIHIYRIYP